MKYLFSIGILSLTLCISASGQTFSHTISDLGTKEEKTITIDGMKVVFPVDQEDVIQLLLPAFEIHRKAREKHATQAAQEMNKTFAELKPDIEKRIKQLLGTDHLSAEFDSAFALELATVEKISRQWANWSGDIREIHFWNRVTVKPFNNPETQKTTFPELEYSPGPEGGLRIQLNPPFINRWGIGIGTFRADSEITKAFRLDIPLFGNPGRSASTIASDVIQLMLNVANGQNKLAIQLAGNSIMNEVIERLLRHEVKAQFFTKDAPNSLTWGMARYYLLLHVKFSEKDNFARSLPNLFACSVPKDTETFLEKLEGIDPLLNESPELNEAAGRILMMAVFMAGQTSDRDKPIFAEFRKQGIAIPSGGFNRDEFTRALRKTYPNIDKQISELKGKLIEMLRRNFQKTAPAESVSTPFVLPEDYDTQEISGLTISYPRSLLEAIVQLAPEWARNLKEAQKVVKKRFNRPVVLPVTISDVDSASLKKYGLTGNLDEIRMWANQTAVVANIDRLIIRLFDGKNVQIWFKKDLIKLMKSGVAVPSFSLNKAKDTVTFAFSFKYKASDSVKSVVEAIASYPPDFFPVILTDPEKLSAATVDEQIAEIRKGDVMLGPLSNRAETVTSKQLTGKSAQFLNDRQSFFVIVHEVAEADLVRQTIASDDRRWFCDGLANVIAIRECDRRFGRDAGMETFHSLISGEKSKVHREKVDLLKWAAAETEDDSIAQVEGLSAAHYFYATQALRKATDGHDTQFIANWISKINATNWTRTNASTVIRAYDELTGEDLRNTLINITKK